MVIWPQQNHRVFVLKIIKLFQVTVSHSNSLKTYIEYKAKLSRDVWEDYERHVPWWETSGETDDSFSLLIYIPLPSCHHKNRFSSCITFQESWNHRMRTACWCANNDRTLSTLQIPSFISLCFRCWERKNNLGKWILVRNPNNRAGKEKAENRIHKDRWAKLVQFRAISKRCMVAKSPACSHRCQNHHILQVEVLL